MTSEEASWKGVHISLLQTSLNHSQFPKLVSDEEHSILFRFPVSDGKVPECFPSIFKKRDYWDNRHVKLPCSEKNVTRDQVNRWNLIRNALTSEISSIEQLQAAILCYNSRYSEQWDFSTLKLFFEHAIDELETAMFFEDLLPKIIDLALRLPELITGGIPLLKRGHKRSVSLSQLQISCLLANAFLCTFPHRNSGKKDAEYFDYPDINFNGLFRYHCQDLVKSVFEKIKCLLNYFRRVTRETPTGVVTYSRQLVPNNLCPDWSKSSKMLPRLYVSSKGTIEDDGFGFFQVDFANKFVGGGVIGAGCVQEEIRFVICPELILSRLFTQSLGDNEALVITGCERFSKYKGYGKTFEWDGDYVDGTPSDEYGRKYCTVIALDALHFMQKPLDQYSPKNISRDMNKAYVGFSWNSRQKKEELCAVATGNWGCGAFRGDPKLKSFLQLIAAGEVGRDLAYFTFGDEELRDGLAATHQFLVENKVTIGRVYGLLGEYYSRESFKTVDIFKFFRNEALKKPEMVNTRPSRTKLSHWFRPQTETNSSKKDLNLLQADIDSSQDELKIDEPESTLMAEKRASETRLLTNFYQQPSKERRSNVETSTEDGFEFLNKFKESLKRKKLAVKGTHGSASKDPSSCDATLEGEQNQNTNINCEDVVKVENSCSDDEIIDASLSKVNLNGDADVKVVSESPNSNSELNMELVDHSLSEKTEIDLPLDNVREKIDLTIGESKSEENCSPQQNSPVNESLEQAHDVDEAFEMEDSDRDMLISNENDTTKNNLDTHCNVPDESRSKEVEKVNLNRNRLGKLSSLALRLKQKTPKRTTPISSGRYTFSASKKRKISDYFSPKTQ